MCNFMSGKCSLVAKPWGSCKRRSELDAVMRKALDAWQGFTFHDPPGCRLGLKQDFSKVDEGVVTLGGGVLNCWAKKQKSVALSS